MHERKLSGAWEEVVKNCNISTQLAENLRDAARDHGSLVGMRLDERSEAVVEREHARKPFYMKLKTVNWGWMIDNIPKDQTHLAKNVNGHLKPADHTPQTANPEKYPELVRFDVKQKSLQEIMREIEKGESELLPRDPRYPNRLEVRPLKNVPDESKVIFSIDLGEQARKQSFAESDAKPTVSFQQPEWWRSEWGNFPDASQFQYPAQYRVGDGAYQDLMLYAVPVFSKEYPEGKPFVVGKDNDGFLRGDAVSEYKNMPKEAFEVVNTFLPGGTEEMFRRLLAIHEHVWKKEHPGITDIPDSEKLKIFEDMSKYKLERFGAGTPADFYEMTHRLNKGQDQEPLKNMQHSFECDSPLPKGKLSDIDAPVLWNSPPTGEPYVTRSQKEHIDFLLPYCDKNVFRVNPSWNLGLELWGQIVLKQLQSNMPVTDKVRTEFFDTVKEDLKKLLSEKKEIDIPTLKKYEEVLRCTKKEEGNEMRDMLYSHIAEQLQQKNESMREVMTEYRKIEKQDPRGDTNNPNKQKVTDAYQGYVKRESMSAIKPDTHEEHKVEERNLNSRRLS